MTTRNRNVLMIATAAAFLAAVLFASTAPAHAKDHGHKNHGRKPGAAQVAPYYTVPQVLTTDYRGTFQPYYSGRAYYAPHGHHHARYRLPVWYGGAVVYRPYAYCGERLFVTGAVTLPQLALAFNFGSPGGGFYLGGYYPAPPPPPAPYYIYENRHHHDGGCDHDHGHDDWDD
jgi:hypothetical protein